MTPKRIELNDKPILDAFFKSVQPHNSDYTFSNLFMWQEGYNIEYAVIDSHLILFSQYKTGDKSAMFPIGEGDPSSALDEIFTYFKQLGQSPVIRMVTDNELAYFSARYGDTFDISERRSTFDYVYLSDDLINLRGKKYHAKRNHINKFLSSYIDWQYVPLDSASLNKCRGLYDKWYESKKDILPDLSLDAFAVHKLLDNFSPLGLTGGAITVDGEVVAFSVGEHLNDDMAVIHLEFADTSYDGAFPMINREFCQREWSGYKFINREEDMGLPGMRKAKESYNPVMYIKKYTAKVL